MGSGLGDLGFWLAVGMVVAAVIVSGALKERERQAALRAPLEQSRERQELLRALLEKGGENMPEVLAYLRERDAAIAARADAMMRTSGMVGRKKMTPRQEMAFAGAFLVGIFAFIGGLFASMGVNHPVSPKFVFSPEAHRILPEYPAPAGWDAYLPLGVMLGVWAAGLIIAVLFVAWGGFGKQKHDAQPDA